MTQKIPFSWSIYSWAADRIVEELQPMCDRIIVAGSIRRRKEEVGDVEILCIPKEGTLTPSGQGALIEPETSEAAPDMLWGYLKDEAGSGVGPNWAYRLNKRGSRIGFGPKNRIMLRAWTWESAADNAPAEVPVDIFVATPETWVTLLVIRTGPKDFNQWTAEKAQSMGAKLSVEHGGFEIDGKIMHPKSEEEYFRLLGLDYVEPIDRDEAWARKLIEEAHRR